MKKFLLLSALLLSCLFSFGQSTMVDQQDLLYQYLDKSRITSGALYNRVFPWAELISHQNTDTIDYAYVLQAWHELYLSKYSPGTLPSIDKVYERSAFNAKDTPIISVGYIDFDIHYIDSPAFTSGALVVNQGDSTFRDGNMSINPYKKKNVVMPLITTAHISASDAWFYFDPSLVLMNGSNKSLKQIKIISGANNIVLTPGQKKKLPLGGSPGSRTFMVEVEFHGLPPFIFPYLFGYGSPDMISSVTSHLCNSGDEPIPLPSGSDLKFQGYDEPYATEGKGEYVIFYKLNDLEGTDCEKKVTKPIIFIDGFDPQDTRWINEVNVTEEGDSIKPIWEFLSYDEDNEHLGDQLRLMGYDIIVLNFPNYDDPFLSGDELRDGGADYIERNAMVLIKLIREVKTMLAINGSTEDIIIAGPSMGGQISRYALAYMEKQYALTGLSQWDHKCRLWISFDSPHHGANIPIGLQQFMYFFGYYYNEVFARKQYNNKIRSVAGRQLLIHQMDGLNGTADYFTEYYDNLESNGLTGSGGYPQNLRKISLVDGMGDGTKVGTAGANSLHLTADATFDIDAAKVIIKNTGSNTTPVKTLDAYALKQDDPLIHFGFGYYHETTTSSIPVTNMSLQTKIADMGLSLPGVPLHAKVFLYEADYFSTNTTGNGSLDVIQGGQHDGIDFLKKTLTKKLNELDIVEVVSIYTNQKTASFMPTVSTLGFYNTNFDWGVAINDRDLVCTEEIPFDNYLFASERNMNHVELNNESARWVKEEIQYGTEGCPNICATGINSTIPGDYMCGTDEYVFSLNELVPSSVGSVFWEPPTGLVPVTHTSINNNSIKLKWDGTSFPPEESYVKATVTPKISGQQCGATKVFYFPVKFGDIFSYELSPSATTDPDFTVYVVPNSLGDYQYKWRDDNADPWPSGFSSNYSRYYYKVDTGVTKYFSVRIYPDGCSTYVKQLTGMYLREGMGVSEDGLPMVSFVPYIQVETPTLMPNPTDVEWQLILPQEWKGKQAVATVYASDGRKMYSKPVTDIGYTTLTTENLAAGVYFIEVISGNERSVVRGIKK